MNNLIELITQITDKEMTDFENPMDKDRKERIAALILNKTEQTPTPLKPSATPFKRKKWLVLLLAATLLFGMASFAADKGQWDIRLMEFWNLTDTTYLQDGAVLLNKESNESNGMTLTARSSIGDKNNVAIILEPSLTAKEQAYFSSLPKNSYLMFEESNIDVFNRKGHSLSSHYGSSIESFLEDGKLYFLLTIHCEDINRKQINLMFKDLYLYKEGNETGTLFKEGTWNLEWAYQYKTELKTYYPFQTADCNGDKVWITRIEISPISIRMTGIRIPFAAYKNRNYNDRFKIEKIFLKNGETFPDFEDSTSGSKNGIFLDYSAILSTPTEPGEISGLQIGNTVISLHKH